MDTQLKHRNCFRWILRHAKPYKFIFVKTWKHKSIFNEEKNASFVEKFYVEKLRKSVDSEYDRGLNVESNKNPFSLLWDILFLRSKVMQTMFCSFF